MQSGYCLQFIGIILTDRWFRKYLTKGFTKVIRYRTKKFIYNDSVNNTELVNKVRAVMIRYGCKVRSNVMSDGRANILIMDDKPDDLLELKGYLESIDCNMMTARSGSEALNSMQGNKFALALLDVIDQQKRLLKIQAELLESKGNELLKLKEVNCHLESISALDGLTGIPNRRTFDQFIEMSWKNAIRVQQPLSLIMADIDYFKAYNDNYGHLQGDDCLIQVAKSLASAIERPNDLIARYGGEEFIALLPDTNKKGALLVAERMRKSIEKLALKHDQSEAAHCVTISLGVAEIIPKSFDSIADFIKNADNALYVAKHQGRNQVHMGSNCQFEANNIFLPKLPMSFKKTVEGVWLSKRSQAKTILGQLLRA